MKNIAIRGAAATAVAGVALGALAAGAANADTFMRLPDGSVTNGAVRVNISNQSVTLSPSMVALPTSRNAWVSGNVSTTITGKGNGGYIRAGYLVGCQVDVGSAKVVVTGGVNTGATYSLNDGPSLLPSATTTSTGTLSLKAGAIGLRYLTWDKATMPKAGDEITPDWALPVTKFAFTGNSGSLAFSDRTIGVDGCAGYAQARFFAQVTAKVGDTEGYTTIWGKPFTLG